MPGHSAESCRCCCTPTELLSLPLLRTCNTAEATPLWVCIVSSIQGIMTGLQPPQSRQALQGLGFRP